MLTFFVYPFSFFSESQLKSLKEDLRASNISAYAEGSRKNLKVQWEAFLLFCLHFELVFLPASTETLQLFAQFLSRSFRSVHSIRNYISGIRVVHQLLGFSLDCINSFLLNLTLRGIARLNPVIVRKAEPITPDILFQIHQILDFSGTDDIVFWCLFLFAFFLVARKSNLVPNSVSDVKKGRCLFKKNVKSFGEHLIVCMNWSKTIQYGERELLTPLLRMEDSILCPVRAFHDLCEFSHPIENGPLFIFKNGKPLTYHMFQKKLKESIALIGLDPNCFSTHSFRRGFATFAFKEQVSSDCIQILGDWRSEAYKNYISLSADDKLKIMQSLRPKLKF